MNVAAIHCEYSAMVFQMTVFVSVRNFMNDKYIPCEF